MNIRRAPRPKSNFYLLDKRISEDRRLSWAARGLLIYLLGKPDDWEVSVAHLVKETEGAGSRRSGRDAVYSLLRELESAGYIKRRQERTDDGGFAKVSYIVSEFPIAGEPAPLTDEPDTGEPLTAEPDTANPTLISIERKTSTERNQELNKTHGPSGDEPRELELTTPSSSPAKKKRKAIDYTQEFEEAWSAYPKREGSNNKRKAYSAWNARLREGVAPEEMLAGVKRYAAYCDAKDITGTQWVMQAQRFFGKDREFENDWSVAQQPSGKPSSATQSRASPHGGYDKIDYSRGIEPDGRF